MTELKLMLQRFAEAAAGDGAEIAAAGEAAPEETLKDEQEAESAQETAEDTDGEPAGEPAPAPASDDAAREPPASPEEKTGAPEEPTVEQRLAALEEALARQSEMLARREQDLAMRQHFSALEKQAEAMKETFPDFDLRTELNDPVFVRLTSPMVGLSVEDAYFAVHHREITEANAQAAAEALGNSVQAGRSMPQENGSIRRGTPEGGYRPLAELSPEERKLRMDLIRSGKLRF